jgi:hypothetical protein
MKKGKQSQEWKIWIKETRKSRLSRISSGVEVERKESMKIKGGFMGA